MSHFDCYTSPEYVQRLRAFLKLPKSDFLRTTGLTDLPASGRKGRLPRYHTAAIKALEEQVNARAKEAETATEFAPRYLIARDYKGLSNAEIARLFGVSRELTRLWAKGLCLPRDISVLASALEVSESWLVKGGEEYLPANSHIGVRVGFEAMQCREQLYAMTTTILAAVSDEAGEGELQSFIEESVSTSPMMSKMARRAGGRWLVFGGELQFAPWVPIQEHGLSRRFWSDEVEAMIDDELASNSTVYGAWHALRARCLVLGLSDSEYPKLITLHKRISKARERTKRFGIRFN